MKLAVTLIAVMLTGSVLAQEPPDTRFIDGDTFEMDGEIIRLWGIDAPESTLGKRKINRSGHSRSGT